MGETKRSGRPSDTTHSQVAGGTSRLGIAGDRGVWNLAPGADGPSKPIASHGIHHASRRPWGSKRNSTTEIHWKWRAYTIAASGVAFAIGAGLTLMEVFNK